MSIVDELNNIYEINEEIELKIAVPQNLVHAEFSLYQICGSEVEKINYELDGDFVVFKTSHLSQYVFSCKYTSLAVWFVSLVICVGILFLCIIFLSTTCVKTKRRYVYLNERKINNSNALKNNKLYVVAPIIFIPWQIKSVVILVIVAVVLFVVCVVLYIRIKKSKKQIKKLEKSISKLANTKNNAVYDKSLNGTFKNSRSVSEGMLLARKTDKNKFLSKKSIFSYVKGHTLKNVVKVKTGGVHNGSLSADVYYIKTLDGRLDNFLYVYESKDGKILLLIKAEKDFMANLKLNHNLIVKSTYPKMKKSISNLMWYSVPIDESYTENEVYCIILNLINLCRK